MIDIPLHSTLKNIKQIQKGMSGDKKYYIETDDNQQLLLRVSDISEYARKKSEYKLMNRLSKLGVPMPKTIDFGICNHNQSVYILLQWIDGKEVEEIVPQLNEREQYSLGYKSGQILRLIHSIQVPEDKNDWFNRYYSVMEERLNAYKTQGIPFEGSDKIISFLERNKYLLKDRPQCYHHGDYHMGNMIRTSKEELYVIDWHTVDFDNYGDPWYEFNRIATQYPIFASGQIDGYFNDNPPEPFWKLFEFYLSASAITSIGWAKYMAPQELEAIIQLNYKILDWFDGMANPIPTWYRTRI